MLEAELRESSNNLNGSSVETTFFESQIDSHAAVVKKHEIDIVSVPQLLIIIRFDIQPLELDVHFAYPFSSYNNQLGDRARQLACILVVSNHELAKSWLNYMSKVQIL